MFEIISIIISFLALIISIFSFRVSNERIAILLIQSIEKSLESEKFDKMQNGEIIETFYGSGATIYLSLNYPELSASKYFPIISQSFSIFSNKFVSKETKRYLSFIINKYFPPIALNSIEKISDFSNIDESVPEIARELQEYLVVYGGYKDTGQNNIHLFSRNNKK